MFRAGLRDGQPDARSRRIPGDTRLRQDVILTQPGPVWSCIPIGRKGDPLQTSGIVPVPLYGDQHSGPPDYPLAETRLNGLV